MDMLRKCVDAMCKSCIYDSKLKEGIKEQISNCTLATCPLFPVRIVVEKKDENSRQTGLKPVSRGTGKASGRGANPRKSRKLPRRGGQKKAAVSKKNG